MLTSRKIRFRSALGCFVAALLAASPTYAVIESQESSPQEFLHEAPRVRSMLEHGWAAEKGIGQRSNFALAAWLYCEAARSGSAEGHYRAGMAYASAPLIDAAVAAAFFQAAVELGREQAMHALATLLAKSGQQKSVVPICLTDIAPKPDVLALEVPKAKFDFDGYMAAMSLEKRKIAGLLVRYAPLFGVDTRLALAIASVESNFDAAATSPMNAKGVMQLIPETATRFRVKNPYDAEDNIRGGLAYLRWLTDYFRGDLIRVIAAYNSGEGAVTKHKGVPPYLETQLYLKRVLMLAGLKEETMSGLHSGHSAPSVLLAPAEN